MAAADDAAAARSILPSHPLLPLSSSKVFASTRLEGVTGSPQRYSGGGGHAPLPLPLPLPLPPPQTRSLQQRRPAAAANGGSSGKEGRQ